MIAIVAVDKNWAIGNKGDLLVRIPTDLIRFKHLTQSRPVIYGRKTMDTFPGKKPLKNRQNVILTHKEEEVPGAIVMHSIDEVLNSSLARTMAVIGGEEVYRELLPYCNVVYVTKIDGEYEADSYFPNLDEDPNWYPIDNPVTHEENGVNFKFVTYLRAGKRGD